MLWGHTRQVVCLVDCPARHVALSGSLDASIRVWDYSDDAGRESREGKEEGTGKGGGGRAGGGAGGGRSWACLYVLKGHGHSFVTSLLVTPKGDQALSCSDDGSVAVWDTKTFERVHCSAGMDATQVGTGA